MGGRSSLPTPGEHSKNDSLGPPSLLRSPWLELGAAVVKYQSSKLSIKSELISKFSQLTSCNKPSYCSIPLRTTSLLLFSLSSMNFLNIIHLNEFSLEKSEQPQLSSLSTFKRLPRSFLG